MNKECRFCDGEKNEHNVCVSCSCMYTEDKPLVKELIQNEDEYWRKRFAKHYRQKRDQIQDLKKRLFYAQDTIRLLKEKLDRGY